MAVVHHVKGAVHPDANRPRERRRERRREWSLWTAKLCQLRFERADAVLLASFLGYSVYAGRLIAGYLLDFIWAPAIACALMIMPAMSMMMFAGADPTYSQMVIAIVLLGVAAGVEYDLLAYLVSRYFGVRSYARIYGALYALFGLGAGFGPAAFGAVYSNTGSYDQALYYSMWGFIICSLALLLLGRYRDEQLKAMV